MARLRLVKLVTLLTLGIVHRNPALAALNEYDTGNHHHRDNAHYQQQQTTDLAFVGLRQRVAHGRRQTGYNTREDQHGYPVTNASLGDLFTQPHHEHRTGDQRHDGSKGKTKPRVVCHRRKQTYGHASTLNQGQQQRTIARVLGNLAATGLAFFLELRQMRIHRTQQLHNNRRRYIGHDAQGHDTHTLKRTTREHVEQTKEGSLVLAEHVRQLRRVDTRHRNMRTYAIHQNGKQQKQQTRLEFAETCAYTFTAHVRFFCHFVCISLALPLFWSFSCQRNPAQLRRLPCHQLLRSRHEHPCSHADLPQ